MKITNSLDRCSLIISLLISKQYQSSILNISNDFNIPIDVVRSDITKLVFNPLIKNSIYFDVSSFKHYENVYKLFDDELNNQEIEDIFEEFYDIHDNELLKICFYYALFEVSNVNKIKKRIKNLITNRNGYLDEAIISIENNSYFSNYLPIPINAQEEALLQKEYPNLIQNKSIIKNTIWDYSLIDNNSIRIINTCINNKHKLKFNYKHKNIVTYTICPSILYINTFDNIAYCIDSDDHIYRLDKMLNIKELNETFTVTNTNTNYDYLWGSPLFKDTESVTHVKVQITYNTSNIINKVENETKYRKYRKFYFDHKLQSYIYEDDILGINNFKRWLRSYGASMIVLEPETLAQDMYKSADLILQNYNL